MPIYLLKIDQIGRGMTKGLMIYMRNILAMVTIFFMLVASNKSIATNYYVDASSGNDDNTGTAVSLDQKLLLVR